MAADSTDGCNTLGAYAGARSVANESKAADLLFGKTSVRPHHAGVDGKALATNQPLPNAPFQDLLKDEAQGVAVPEPAVPILQDR